MRVYKSTRLEERKLKQRENDGYIRRFSSGSTPLESMGGESAMGGGLPLTWLQSVSNCRQHRLSFPFSPSHRCTWCKSFTRSPTHWAAPHYISSASKNFAITDSFYLTSLMHATEFRYHREVLPPALSNPNLDARHKVTCKPSFSKSAARLDKKRPRSR
jgi:hypothetical protein